MGTARMLSFLTEGTCSSTGLQSVQSGGKSPLLLQRLAEHVKEICSGGDERRRRLFKAECTALSRRIGLLSPLFEELTERRGAALPEQITYSLTLLEEALLAARELLRRCSADSKIYLVLELETVQKNFQAVTAKLGQALDLLPCSLLVGISYEVQEQVELAHAHLKGAKETSAEMHDVELHHEVVSILLQESDKAVDGAVLERVAEKLQLKTLSAIKQEQRALNSLFGKCGEEGIANQKWMLLLLRRLKEHAMRDHTLLDVVNDGKCLQPERPGSPLVPDDFRCPISLGVMEDPVIVATGQTYERACIQKWLDAGNKTCPKTQQILPHSMLIPNYVLKGLITQWCETNGIKIPKKTYSNGGHAIKILLQKLTSGQPGVLRAAVRELRLLAKSSAENRVRISEAGAIPLLVGLLFSPDELTQEHAVTALLNLSIQEENKGVIVAAGAIQPIVEVMKIGNMEARENAAAALFSLSAVHEHKVTIGASAAIPALVDLLQEGSLRGKKDAATALYNLCTFQGNQARAVRASIVPVLVKLLVDPSLEMVDESLSILAILSSHQEGQAAVGADASSAIPALIEIMKNASPRNKENAATVMVALCLSDSAHRALAWQMEMHGPLIELARNGTPRACRKASFLLHYINQKTR